MSRKNTMTLQKWGWNEQLENSYTSQRGSGLFPGRITKESRRLYTVITEDGVITAEISGAFHYKTASRADYPVIGDWILYRPAPEQKGIIESVFQRKSSFSRKAAGLKTEEQVIAANIDIIYLVFGLNGGRNFTPGGLERYLTLAWESGAVPEIILNKADLCKPEERERFLLTTENTAPGVTIHMISAVTGEGIFDLTAAIEAGTTIALTGPSGVGKSTLINTLAGRELQKTTTQREGDQKGRHTTTRKEMFLLTTGIILIDTPGLKEIQLWAHEQALAETFEEITRLAKKCRFKDCSHQEEPGCAVQDALIKGELDRRRYENYLEMEKELKYLKSRQDANAARLEKEKWKEIAKLQKEFKKR